MRHDAENRRHRRSKQRLRAAVRRGLGCRRRRRARYHDVPAVRRTGLADTENSTAEMAGGGVQVVCDAYRAECRARSRAQQWMNCLPLVLRSPAAATLLCCCWRPAVDGLVAAAHTARRRGADGCAACYLLPSRAWRLHSMRAPPGMPHGQAAGVAGGGTPPGAARSLRCCGGCAARAMALRRYCVGRVQIFV
jgi:hypothetical protein